MNYEKYIINKPIMVCEENKYYSIKKVKFKKGNGM